ncbi:hypothetical protein KSP40_PGU001096 [Platanthera guangdongensis]|uniref:Uncharacterized protein n=1 Tax=Platanthera guangdongensis TaxID=2320717 RepID=A0ABR2MZ14_9ASPA
MSEETKSADINGPRGIISAIGISIIFGWGYLLGITFTVTNILYLLSVDNDAGGYAVAELRTHLLRLKSFSYPFLLSGYLGWTSTFKLDRKSSYMNVVVVALIAMRNNKMFNVVVAIAAPCNCPGPLQLSATHMVQPEPMQPAQMMQPSPHHAAHMMHEPLHWCSPTSPLLQ